MIDFIKGDLVSYHKGSIVIESYGIGYFINVPDSDEYRNLKIGSSVKLMTVMNLNDGIPELFGFLTSIERDMFLEIRSISSFGARLSMATLSTMPLNEIANAIVSGNKKILKSISGMGDKKAERLILELKNSQLIKKMAFSSCRENSDNKELEMAEEALIGLGCSSDEAHKYALSALEENFSADADLIVSRALELMK